MEHHTHSESCHHGVEVTEVQPQATEFTDSEVAEKSASEAAFKKDKARRARNKRKGAVRSAKIKAKNKEETRKAKKGLSFGTVLALREVHNKPSPERTRRVLRDARRKQADAMRKINKLKMSTKTDSEKLSGKTTQVVMLDDSMVVE